VSTEGWAGGGCSPPACSPPGTGSPGALSARAGGLSPARCHRARWWHAWPGATSPAACAHPGSPSVQDDYIKSWEDKQPGDEGTAGTELGQVWGAGGLVTAGLGQGTLSARIPRASPFRPGAAAGPVRAGKRQLVPRRLPSCSLNGALCRAGWRPALPGLPGGPCPPPLCPQPWTPPRTPARR